MKKFALLVAVLIFFSCTSQQPIPDIFKERVLILGDSITQDGRYVSVIEYKLFKHYPHADFDIISIGLSGETLSGLSEPDHDPPRPWVLGRLDSALKVLKPAHVVTCYGMNDGIYHPQSPERMAAFQKGYQTLIDKVTATGADVFVLTPPFFDKQQKPNAVAKDAEQFGYRTAYVGYNDVLADYAEWLLTIQDDNVQIADLNKPMLDYVAQQRVNDPDFFLSKDGIHPGLAGHILMADIFLKAVGVPVADADPVAQEKIIKNDPLYKIVQQRRKMRSMAWLRFIGNDINRKIKGLPVDEAEEKAAQLKVEINTMLSE